MISQPTVILVDDDEAVRDALGRSLRLAGLVVDAYASGHEFLAAYRPDRPGCLLMDLRMPGLDGLEVQKALAERHISIPVIFMSGSGSIRDSVEAIKGGAVDFLEKPFSRTLLLERIHEALARDSELRKRRQQDEGIRARCASLTPREKEILGLIAAGNTAKETAKALGISPRTVEHHRAQLLYKLQASSLTELGVLASICLGWEELPH